MASAFVCPFCQSPRVSAVAIEGLRQNVTRFRCAACERTWAAVIGGGRPAPTMPAMSAVTPSGEKPS